MNIINGDKMI